MVIKSFRDVVGPESDSEHDDDPSTSSFVGGEKSGLAVKNPKKGKLRIKEFEDGVEIDGEFFQGEPARLILESVKSGRVPPGWESWAAKNGEAQVEFKTMGCKYEDERRKDVSKPSPLFQGSGNTLGGGAGRQEAKPTIVPASGQAVDDSKPITIIQFRFPDGRRVTQNFNEDAAVATVFGFVSDCAQQQAIELVTGFPPIKIEPTARSIKDAGLCGAAVTVKRQ